MTKPTWPEQMLKVVKSKTVWFSMVLALLSVAQGFVFQLELTTTQEMYLGAGIAMAIAFLRAITTTPLSEK